MPRAKSAKKTAKKAAKKATTPKKAAKAAAPSSAVERFVHRINASAHYRGKAQLSMAHELQTSMLLRRPTGILSVDIATGGGLPACGPTEIHGAESSGKTHMGYRTCGECQRNYGEDTCILIYATEYTIDKSFARLSGFCVAYSDEEITEYNEMRAARGDPPFTDEEVADLKLQIGEVLIHSAATADIGLDLILDALDEGIFQIIMIESLGALLPKEVDEDFTGDRHYGGSSHVVTQFQNKAYPKFIMNRADGSRLETTVIGINQARASIDGGKYAPKTRAAAGAYAWKHGQLISMLLEKGAYIREEKGAPPVGSTVRWKLTKGKAGTHDGKKGDFNFYFLEKHDPVFWRDVEAHWMGGIDVWTDAAEEGKRLGVVQGSTWLQWRDIKAQGAANFAQELASAEDEAKKLFWDDCHKAANVIVRYT